VSSATSASEPEQPRLESEKDREIELGPPPRSSVDWYFTPRPGRQLDAARVKLADDEFGEFDPSTRNYLKSLPGLIGDEARAFCDRVVQAASRPVQALVVLVRGWTRRLAPTAREPRPAPRASLRAGRR
jgi:hypothetical protein